jgi:hypothetical protein
MFNTNGSSARPTSGYQFLCDPWYAPRRLLAGAANMVALIVNCSARRVILISQGTHLHAGSVLPVQPSTMRSSIALSSTLLVRGWGLLLVPGSIACCTVKILTRLEHSENSLARFVCVDCTQFPYQADGPSKKNPVHDIGEVQLPDEIDTSKISHTFVRCQQ